MIRRLLLAGCWLLCGAAPLPVHLVPAQPVLGRPLTLSIPLPASDTVLGGIPPLGGFELLAPPRAAAGELHLLLLPMRLGLQQIPSFPLLRGVSGQQATLALSVTVVDDLPATAAAAPLMELPAAPAPAGRGPWLLPGLLLLLASAAIGWRWRRRPAPPRPPPLEQLTGPALLSELARRLAQLPPTSPTLALRSRLEQARFAPLATEDIEEKQLLRDFLALSGGSP